MAYLFLLCVRLKTLKKRHSGVAQDINSHGHRVRFKRRSTPRTKNRSANLENLLLVYFWLF